MVKKTDQCKDCSHYESHTETEYCYMFLNPPKEECMQHDKYKELRRIGGKFFSQVHQFFTFFLEE